jgi:hypothetical protein
MALLVALTVYASLPPNSKQRAYGFIIGVGVFFALLSIPFNLLTGSSGETDLFTLPSLSFPDWLGGVVLLVSPPTALFAAERAFGSSLCCCCRRLHRRRRPLLAAAPRAACAQTDGRGHGRGALIPQTLQQAKSVGGAAIAGRARPEEPERLAVPVQAGPRWSIQRAESLTRVLRP